LFSFGQGEVNYINGCLAWKCVIIFVVESDVYKSRVAGAVVIVYFLSLVFTTALEGGQAIWHDYGERVVA
jgi:hypothetical protein